MITYKFTCSAGKARVDIHEDLQTARSEAYFKTWGFASPGTSVDGIADALEQLAERLSKNPEAEPIVDQIRLKIEELKQGELFEMGEA